MDRKKRLLIVDDEADFLQTASQRLAFEGFDVMEAMDGDSALEILSKGDLPDLVLLDIMMPRISGIDVFKRMRGDPRTAEIPVIFLTVWEHLLADRSIQSDRFCASMYKPFDFEALVKLINEVLEGKWPSKG